MSNTAAIITGSKEPSNLTTIKTIPIPEPKNNEILIKTIAYAANPTDWKHIYFISAPNAISGTDTSGIVVKVGSEVDGFQVGDYVSTFIHGNTNEENGAFARYVLGVPTMTIKHEKFSDESLSQGVHPSDLIKNFEGASSVTLGLSTIGMSFAGNLKINPNKSENGGLNILIWGGSTATGILAIQVAKQIYGLNVVTTASPKNHDFLKSIGADATFDYHDSKSLKLLTNYDFSYVLDTVSSNESYQESYNATVNSKSPKLDNLTALDESKIVKRDDNNVEFVTPTFSYLANGHDIDALGKHWELTKDVFSRYKQFWFKLLPPLIPFLKTANLRVLKPGFESVDEALGLLKDNKVSAEKVVFRS